MNNVNDCFLKRRLTSLNYAVKDAFMLLKTEHFISVIGFIVMIAGFHFGISKIEWMFQVFGIGAMTFTVTSVLIILISIYYPYLYEKIISQQIFCIV